MRLSREQVQSFLDQGYLVVTPNLEPSEIVALEQAFDATLARLRDEGRLQNVQSGKDSDDAAQVYQLRTAHLLHERFDAFVRDPRILDIAESIVGPNIRLVHYQGLYKPPRSGGEVGWHQDDYYFRITHRKRDGMVSAWVALDDATLENGCLWYVPGGHQTLLPHVQNWDPEVKKGFYFSIPALDEELANRAIPVPIRKGQMVLHHGLMPHRSLKNASERPRRALAMHFFDASLPDMWDLFKNAPPETTPILRGTDGSAKPEGDSDA
jgi:ectoine hydroxylase-related dioxygenase (phytanoyl-CoA dioxygenase family)